MGGILVLFGAILFVLLIALTLATVGFGGVVALIIKALNED